MIRLNQDKKWQQVNGSEVFGNIKGIWGADLESNPGAIRISTGLQTSIINSATLTTFTGYPARMIFTNAGTTIATNTYANWIISNGVAMFTDNNGGLAFVKDSLTNTPTACVYDMDTFIQSNSVDNLIVATTNDLWRLNNNVWNNNFWTSGSFLAQATALSSTDPHPVSSFLSQYGSYCLIGDANKVHTIDTSLTSAGVRYARTQVENNLQIIWIRSTDTRVFIGTRNLNKGRAKVYEYDIINEVLKGYELNGSISFGVTIKNNLVYTMDNLGIAYKYNGNGFDEVGYLPIYYLQKDDPNSTWDDGSSPQHMIHHRGMAIIDGIFHVLVRAIPNLAYMYEEFPSGIWALNENTGNFYCKYRLSNMQTGEKGQGLITDSGFLTLYTSSSEHQNSFFAGFTANTGNATGTKSFVTRPLQASTPYCSFITPKIFSPDIQSRWVSLWAIFKKLENSTDSIVVKYKIKNRLPTFFSLGSIGQLAVAATFTNSTTFTTTDSNFASAQVGDEIQVIRGSCSGNTAHITAISLLAGTYTVAIDETFTLSGDNTALIQVYDWIKISSFSSTNPPQYTEFHVAGGTASSEWIQFKIELRGTPYSPEINDLIIELVKQLQVA